MSRRSKPCLRIYRGQQVPIDVVFDWCRRAPYHLRWSVVGPVLVRGELRLPLDGGTDVTTGHAIELFPAFVERVRAVALLVSA
jgi:hypothetical protein